uniref:Secreted protein n=1 Tax=Thraustotheca clavata TaxID=74557 RepID=A0A0A7CLL7_9STRA|nr:secreted protein [Thraustotheca clavata]
MLLASTLPVTCIGISMAATSSVLTSRELFHLIVSYQAGTDELSLLLHQQLLSIDLPLLLSLQQSKDPSYTDACIAAFAPFHQLFSPTTDLCRVTNFKMAPVLTYYGLVYGVLPVITHFDAINNTQWIVAATFGHLHVLQHLHCVDRRNYTSRAMQAAAEHGHLALVIFLCENQYPSTHLMHWACVAGQREIAEFAQMQRLDRATGAATINATASAGYVNTLQLLHEGFSQETMDAAAKYGHLEVVKFLHLVRKEEGTFEAMVEAAGNGHLEVVKYLDENYHGHDIPRSLYHAAFAAQRKVVEYFYETHFTDFNFYNTIEAIKAGQESNMQRLQEYTDLMCYIREKQWENVYCSIQ